ncbi:Spermatogenesis associated-like protein [Operophtera brumata]|uniref:Spermatogenesis associated-like protein n=1 Tax=Operophtera brumata TaxID=104452 RepID=A0A0L7L2V5_OPEBR|nr:Spermatogenesis associated-like protein [Operophtera brumata]
MPKLIELTIEIEIQMVRTTGKFCNYILQPKFTLVRLYRDFVSCPGVWLCQDGRVSLSVYALGTNYQTCLLPPVFPLLFKDIFYFRKRFQEMCAVNNICCLLKDETIYCELVQWSENCKSGQCSILAQYLGALDDVLFPPNMCSNDGLSDAAWIHNDPSGKRIDGDDDDGDVRSCYETNMPHEDKLQKLILESRYIEEELDKHTDRPARARPKLTPCVCEICKRYHQLFHST